MPNLRGHDDGNTWNVIFSTLSELYEVKETVLSPHHFGIPQHRSRIYIVGKLKTKGGLKDFQFPPIETDKEISINNIIINDDEDYMKLKEATKNHLNVWQEFLNNIEPENVPRFPIWAMEFGATYEFENKAPIKQKKKI